MQRVLTLVASLAIIFTAVFGSVGTAIASPIPGGTKICTQYWHQVVGKKYIIRNDFFGNQDKAQCLVNHGGTANFRVSVSKANNPGWKVQAFPNVFYGCEYGVCSPGSVLPHRADGLGRLRSYWAIKDHGIGGIWNAGYDIWLSKSRQTNGKANGAELMIWPNAHRVAYSSHQVVKIDGVRYYYASWHIHRGNRSWQYIQFRRVHPTSHLRVKIKSFMLYATHRHNMRMKWWVEAVEAGFEIWKGGQGLATTDFATTLQVRH